MYLLADIGSSNEGFKADGDTDSCPEDDRVLGRRPRLSPNLTLNIGASSSLDYTVHEKKIMAVVGG